SAALGITSGQPADVEILPDQPFAGGGALDFGDHRTRLLVAQGTGEVACGAGRGCGAFQFGAACLECGDFSTFDGQNTVQNGVHCGSACVYAASSFMRDAAAPEVRTSSARVTPAARSAVRPETYSAAPALNATISLAIPGLPSSTSRISARLSSALVTRRASSEPRCRPTSSGAIL